MRPISRSWPKTCQRSSFKLTCTLNAARTRYTHRLPVDLLPGCPPVDNPYVLRVISITAADNWYFVVIRKFSADPFPRLSVKVGITFTFLLRSEAPSLKKAFTAATVASASKVATMRAGLSPGSHTHGRSLR